MATRTGVRAVVMGAGLLAAAQAFAQAPEESGADPQGYLDGAAAAGCELAELLGAVLFPAVAPSPGVGDDEWAAMVEAMSEVAGQCGFAWTPPARDRLRQQDPSMFGLARPRPPGVLPPDPERRIGDASCQELERRYRRYEIMQSPSHRDRLYRRAVGEELRKRCW